MLTWNTTRSGNALITQQLRRIYERIKPRAYQLLTSPHTLLSDTRRLWTIEWKTHLIQAIAVYWVYETRSGAVRYSNAMNAWLDQFYTLSDTGWVFDSWLYLRSSRHPRVVAIFAPDTFQLMACTIGSERLGTLQLVDFSEAVDDTVKLGALEQVWNKFLELHEQYTVAASVRLGDTMREATKEYISNTHPLRDVLVYVEQQLHCLAGQAHRFTSIPTLQNRTPTLTHEYQERQVFSQSYFDVKRRIKKRCATKHKQIPQRVSDADDRVRMVPHLVLEQLHPWYQQLMNERTVVQAAFFELLDDLRMSTQHNVEFELWSSSIQEKLGIQPNALTHGTAYRSFYFLCDIIQLLALHRQQLRLLDVHHIEGIERENCYSLYTRVNPWRAEDMLQFVRHTRPPAVAAASAGSSGSGELNKAGRPTERKGAPRFCRQLSTVQTSARRAHRYHAIRQQPFLV